MAEVRYTTLFQITGDDQPRPGTSMTHLTFSVIDQVSGRAGASATPLADGPRKPGQLDVGAAKTEVPATNRPIAATRRIDPPGVMTRHYRRSRVRRWTQNQGRRCSLNSGPCTLDPGQPFRALVRPSLYQ